MEALRTLKQLHHELNPDSPWVFLNEDGEKVRGHRDWFEPALKNSGVSDYSWHCNRHTFASRLVMAGVDLRTVGELLGHRTPSMTWRYSHLAPSHQQRAVDRLVSSRDATQEQKVASATRTATRTLARCGWRRDRMQHKVYLSYMFKVIARVAELADAPDLGSTDSAVC